MPKLARMNDVLGGRVPRSEMAEHAFPRGSVVWVDHTNEVGRLRCAYPMIVVADHVDLTALYIPQHTSFFGPVDSDGQITRDMLDEAGVGPASWNDHAGLHLIPAGASYTAMARWRTGWDDFAGWHVSFQRPLRRTATGFDTCDFTLDIEVFPDYSWAYKDEAEYWTICAAGLFDAESRTLVERAAEETLGRLDAVAPPFRQEIAAWRPSPDWTCELVNEHFERRAEASESESQTLASNR